MYKVDLNSDLGESFGAYTIRLDSQVVQYALGQRGLRRLYGRPAGDGQTVAAAKGGRRGHGCAPPATPT